MKTRIQLIQNSALHRVPTVLLSIYKTQFIFNVIPTMLRHRKNHKLNLYNSSHIFFTKNSIQTLGGLPNYLLFRSGAQSSNPSVANRIHIFADQQVYNYLEKLRFKLGYKILRTSFCNWTTNRNRVGIIKMSLLNQFKNDAELFKKFIKIDEILTQKYEKNVDYYDSRDFISNKQNEFINIPTHHFHHELIDIYPLQTSEGGAHCSYVCIPTIQRKGVNVNIEQFMHKTGITKLSQVKKFIYTGFIKDKNGSIIKKQDFVFKQNYKPNNIIIFHYANAASISQLMNHKVLKCYFDNKNETGAVVHIVEDLSLIKTTQFKNLMSKFDSKVKHLWFNQHSHIIDPQIDDNSHHSQVRLWSHHFPWLFNLVQTNRRYLNYGRQTITQQFPNASHYFYQQLYNLIINDYVPDRYEKRKEAQKSQNKLDALKNLFLEQNETLTKLKQSKNLSISKHFKPKVTFLGTSSSMPTPYRNTLGIHVSLDKNISFILDCGQGTLQQFADQMNSQKYQNEILKIRVIFITHIHADHNLGILNFISQRNRIMKEKKSKEKLFLIIPFNVLNWYEEFNRTIQDLSQGCTVLFTQLLTCNLDQLKLEIQKTLNNPIGFFRKRQKCIKQTNYLSQIFTSSKTKEMVIKELPNQTLAIQSFKSLLKDHGYKEFLPVKVIHCPQSYGIIIQNDKFKVSYSGDTRPAIEFADAAKDSNLMIHQATFNDQESQKAVNYLHSSVKEAVQIGKKANAQKIVLTHFNENFKWSNLLQSNQDEFFNKNTIFSFDHLNLYLESLHKLPKVTQFMMKMDYLSSQNIKKTEKAENIDEQASEDSDIQ